MPTSQRETVNVCARARLMGAAVAIIAGSLSGCANLPTVDESALGAPVPKGPVAPVTCASKPECDLKWSRALIWVTKNSPFRLQIANDVMIQTMHDETLNNSTDPMFTVVKTPLGNGSFEITFDGGCTNPFGCIPSVAASRATFAAFFNAPIPAAPVAQAQKN
jgi:hypothetical protein